MHLQLLQLQVKEARISLKVLRKWKESEEP